MYQDAIECKVCRDVDGEESGPGAKKECWQSCRRRTIVANESGKGAGQGRMEMITSESARGTR